MLASFDWNLKKEGPNLEEVNQKDSNQTPKKV